MSAGYYDAYYLRAQKVRTKILNDFEEAFKQCDALLTPATPSAAFGYGEKGDDPVAMYLNDIFTVVANLTGQPALSHPCGTDENGQHVGMQIIGNYLDEARMLNVAHQFQLATDWHKRHPSI